MVKDILIAAREKQRFIFKGLPIRLPADSSKETAGKKGLAKSIQSVEKQEPASKITLSSKAIIWNRRADKLLPRQGKAKGINHQQAIIT